MPGDLSDFCPNEAAAGMLRFAISLREYSLPAFKLPDPEILWAIFRSTFRLLLPSPSWSIEPTPSRTWLTSSPSQPPLWPLLPSQPCLWPGPSSTPLSSSPTQSCLWPSSPSTRPSSSSSFFFFFFFFLLFFFFFLFFLFFFYSRLCCQSTYQGVSNQKPGRLRIRAGQ